MAMPPVPADTACLRVDNDIVIDGTVMTALQGSNLNLYMDNFFGSSPIDTSGGDDVADAGDLYIGADNSFYNEGNMTAKGADSSTGDAGHGGEIWVESKSGDFWNKGNFNTAGGTSTFAGGFGGDGGPVYFYADITGMAGGGTLYNAGAIDTTGGDGDGGGGDGGYVGSWLDGPAGG